jgi:hypothetical protein
MSAELVAPADAAPKGPRLTEELAEKLLKGAQTGLFRHAVAESIGLDPDVLDLWLEMGLSSEAVQPYRGFALRYRAAEQAAQLPYIQSIQAAATVDYKAAVLWLQLRYPEQWGVKASKNTQAGVLKPTAGDEAAEEAMVDQLFDLMPPALQRVLARRGIAPSVEPAKTQGDDATAKVPKPRPV